MDHIHGNLKAWHLTTPRILHFFGLNCMKQNLKKMNNTKYFEMMN